MTINKFFENHLEEIQRDILSKLNREFSAHEFIQKFSQAFQTEYTNFLSKYKSSPFRIVHSLIAKALLRFSLELNIRKIQEKQTDPNIFGNRDRISGWIKTN